MRKAKKRSKGSILEERLFAEFRFFSLPMPVRQLKFHPTRDWKFDFAWPDRKMAVEINGGIFIFGGHNRGAQMEDDYEKINEAQRLGWKVYTFGPVACRRKKRSATASPALAYLAKLLKSGSVELESTQRKYPYPCGLCPGQIESQQDTEWHGLGNCVEICERCIGSGIEPKKTTGDLFNGTTQRKSEPAGMV